MSPGLNFAEITDEYYEAVYRFCARRVGCEAAADVAQETFLTAIRVQRAYRGGSSIRTWLFGIANNCCRGHLRKERSTPPTLQFDPASERQEDAWVDRHVLSLALAKLSDEHRDVVLLHEVEGLTYEEAGQVLGIPAGTVKSRLHHAFTNLRAALAPTRNYSQGGEIK